MSATSGGRKDSQQPGRQTDGHHHRQGYNRGRGKNAFLASHPCVYGILTLLYAAFAAAFASYVLLFIAVSSLSLWGADMMMSIKREEVCFTFLYLEQDPKYIGINHTWLFAAVPSGSNVRAKSTGLKPQDTVVVIIVTVDDLQQ